MLKLTKFLDSNRTGHMTAAIVVGLGLVSVGVAKQSQMAVTIGGVVPAWEFLATMDMDHESRKISGSIWRRLWLTYWLPYKMLVPHRSEFSHSLLLGTSIRLVYVLLPFILVAVAKSPFISRELLDWAVSNPGPALDWLWGWIQEWRPGPALDWLWGWILEWRWLVAGAAVADLVHLLKDGYLRYGLGSILLGR